MQLSKFACLCEDGVWGVRNACAECFVQVSRVCSMQVRRTNLTQLFVDLLCDQSRWVSHIACIADRYCSVACMMCWYVIVALFLLCVVGIIS